MAYKQGGTNPWLTYNRAAEQGELPQTPQNLNPETKLNYPDWWPAMREFKAPPVEGQPYWTPRRIGRYYNALKSVPYAANTPNWIDQPGIEAAYKYLQESRNSDWQTWEDNLDTDPALKEFVGSWAPPPITAIPKWEQDNFAALSDALKTTEGPVGEWTRYGIDYATWQKLPEWKKYANRFFRSMGGQMGQQALNLGIAGASVAGVPGFFGGAAAGAGMGYLGVKEQERQAEMLAAGLQYKPGVAYYMMGTLNFLFTQAQQAMALRQQAQNALVDPQTYGSISEILKDIPAAYEAGEAFYSLLPYEVGSAFSKDGKVRVVNIAGEDTFIEAAPKGEFGSGVALTEIRRMLASGKLSPEQVREYTIQKYGFLSEMTDLLAGYVLDPLDMIGPVTSGIIGNRADISGNVPLAKAFLGEGAPRELLTGYKLYRRNLREMPVNDVIKMGNVTRWFAGFDPEGIDVRLKQPGASGNFAQRFVDKAFGMTAESRAIDLQHDFVNGMKNMLGAEEGNVDGMYRMVGKFAELTPEKTVEAVENAKVKVSVGGVDTEVDMPRWALSGEAQSIPLMLKDQMPKVNDHYDQWKTTRPQAELLQRFADAVGEDVHKLKADLHGDNPKTDYDTLMRRITALANEGDAKAKAFLNNVGQMKDLNNAALKKAAGLFLGENGAAFDPGMWAAQLIYILEEGADAWAVKWFGIKPSGWVYRLAGVIKQAQGILLLGLNPAYLANNAVNNVVTMAWDGLLGTMSKKMRADYLRRFGIPTKLRQGIGGAETGVKESDIGQKVRAATRGQDIIQGTSDLLHGTDKVQAAAILSQKVERWSSEVSTVKGLMEFMGREWRAGRGFDKITGDLRLVLDAARAGLADEVERLIANGLNKTEIEKNIFTKVGIPSLKDVMTSDEYTMMNSFPGLVDDIDKGIRDATSDEEIRKVFNDAINKAQKAIDDDISRKAMAIMHSYAIGVQVDGLQFVHDKLDTLVPDRHDNWQLHFDHMGEVVEQAKKLSGIELHNLWATERQAASEQWRTFTNAEGAKWLGIFEGLGAERMSAESALVTQNLSDVHDVWNNFFQHTQDRMQELFDYKDTTDFTGLSENEVSALISAKWAEVSEKLNSEYIDSSLVEDLYQVELDDLLKKRARQELSYQKAQEIGEWRDEQLKVRRTMIQAMSAFRTGSVPETMLAQFGSLLPADTLAKIRLLNDGNALYKLSRAERDNANKKFYQDIYRPLIGSMMERATPETKGAKPQAKETAPAPKEVTPTTRKFEETAIWKLIAEKHPELAGVDEQGRINFDAKLAIIKWLRKWSAEARARNVKKWADVTPALILEAWQAEQAAPKVETPPVVEAPTIAEAVEPVAVGEIPAETAPIKEVAVGEQQEVIGVDWQGRQLKPGREIMGGTLTPEQVRFMDESFGNGRVSTVGYSKPDIEEMLASGLIKHVSTGMKTDKYKVYELTPSGRNVREQYVRIRDRAIEEATLSASLTEEAALTDGMTPEAAVEFEAVQRAEVARENVIAKANDMRENANDLLMLAPPKEVNGDIFREYLHQVFADRYPDKPEHGATRAEAIWTVIDRIATTLSREQGITKDQWYQNFVLERGGTELSGNALYVSDPAKFIANVDRIEYQRGQDWYEYNIILKDGTSDTATVGADELRTVLGDTVAQKIIDGDSFGSLQGNDLQGLSTSGFLVRRATGATYWLENGRAVIHAFSRADVADMLHEYVHAITPMLPDGDKATVKAWYEAEYKRVLPDDWSDKSASDVDAMEKLARAFERYMAEGPTGFTGEIVRVFSNIKKWMLDIYKSLTHNDINVRMNDDMRGMFDRWLGAEPKAEPATVEPPAPKPDMWQKRKAAPTTIAYKPGDKVWYPAQRDYNSGQYLIGTVKQVLDNAVRITDDTGTVITFINSDVVPYAGGRLGGMPAPKTPQVDVTAFSTEEKNIIAEQLVTAAKQFEEAQLSSKVSTEDIIRELANEKELGALPVTTEDGFVLKVMDYRNKPIKGGDITAKKTDKGWLITYPDSSLAKFDKDKSNRLDRVITATRNVVKQLSQESGTWSPFKIEAGKATYTVENAGQANRLYRGITGKSLPGYEDIPTKNAVLLRTETRAITRGEWSAFEDSPGHLVIEHNGEQKATADIDAAGVPSDPTYAELTLPERNEVTVLLREFKQTYQQRTSYPPGMLYRKSPATPTPEFKAWFGDSKIVDENGQPLVVYHGSPSKFETFDFSKLGTNGFSEGVGFYFTDNKGIALGYSRGNASGLYEVYLSINKPMDLTQKKITKAQLKQMLLEIHRLSVDDPDNNIGLSNYGDVTYEGLDKVINTAANMEYGNPTDADMIASIVNGGSVDPETMNRIVTKVTGYDGIIAKWEHTDPQSMVYVAFLPEQIKSVNNRGTFSRNTGNILYRTPADADGKPFEPPPAANSPLGTADELTGMPVEDITLQGWTQHARPAIERAQRAVLAQKREKLNLQETLTKEGDALLRAYLGKVYTQLADTKMAATKWGESRRSAALLDYNKRTGFDQLAGMIFPYQFWYTRTAINWFLRALNKPSIIANYFRLMRMSQRAERDDGYPQRLKGKMALPTQWLPDFMGGTVYVDPWKQAFPLLQITRPLEKYAQEKNQIERRTDQILYEMVDDGTATDEDVQNAIDTRTGNLYIKAKAQAESEDQRDFENPFDFAAALSSPSLPLSFAYNWMMGRKDRIGQLPFTRLVQNMTAMAGIGGPRGVNLEGWWRKGLGLPEVDQWEDYRVSRELANMVAEGLTDPDTANKAMIDRTGDVFVEAQRRVSQTGAVRYMGSTLALDIFPEGEMIQRGLQDEFAAAYDAKAAGDKDAVNKFFDKYPEYSSRMLAMKNEPEEQMRSFLKGIVWEKYLALPKAQAKEFRAAAGELFEDAFLNSETRSYDSISTDTFAMWANALNKDTVSEKAGGAALPVDWLDDETAKAIDAYYNTRTSLFGEYDPNAELDPNYTNWQNQYLAAHPDIIQYVIGETNKLYGLPEDIQRYVYAYRAERDQRYPGIFDTQEKYFALSQSQRKGFIKAHPELKSYWDFRRQKAADFPKAAAYIMSEESLSAEILDEDRVSYSGGGSTGGYTSGYSNATYSDGRPAENYHPPYLTSSEIRRFSQPLIMQLLARFYRNEKLMPGAYAELTSIWEQLGKPFGNMEDFIENAVKPTIMQ